MNSFPVTAMQNPVSVLAVSKRGRSRIGASPVQAVIEQDKADKLFLVFPQLNQCRWIAKNDDPDFRIVLSQEGA